MWAFGSLLCRTSIVPFTQIFFEPFFFLLSCAFFLHQHPSRLTSLMYLLGRRPHIVGCLHPYAHTCPSWTTPPHLESLCNQVPSTSLSMLSMNISYRWSNVTTQKFHPN